MTKTMLKALCKKLHPQRFTAMSPKMSAIVACVLGQKWTDPRLVALVTTSDGFVLAQREGDVGFDAFIGSESDLRSNWGRLLADAGLDEAESAAAEAAFKSAVRRA
jgi:hypothetical protein